MNSNFNDHPIDELPVGQSKINHMFEEYPSGTKTHFFYFFFSG